MILVRVGIRSNWHSKCQLQYRSFATTPTLSEKPLPPRRAILDDEITESFLKGSGPGGQKINKTSSAVQLKHLPTGIVIKNQSTRSRDQNRKFARKVLAEKLEELEKGDQSRTAIKAEKVRTKKASANKKSKRKYRQLEEQRSGDKPERSEVAADDGATGVRSKHPNTAGDRVVGDVSEREGVK